MAVGGLGVAVLLNRGNGVFTTPLYFAAPAGASVNSVALGDLNGDGKLDVVAAYESGVSELLNTSQ